MKKVMFSWKFLTLCILFQTVLSFELSRIIENASLQRSKKGSIDPKPGGHVGLLGFSLSDALRNIQSQNEAGANRHTSYFQFQPDRTLKKKMMSKEAVKPKNPKLSIKSSSRAKDSVRITENVNNWPERPRFEQSDTNKPLAEKNTATGKSHQPHEDMSDGLQSSSKFNSADQNGPGKANDKLQDRVSSDPIGLPERTSGQKKIANISKNSILENSEEALRARESSVNSQVPKVREDEGPEILRGSLDRGTFEKSDAPRFVESQRDVLSAGKSNSERGNLRSMDYSKNELPKESPEPDVAMDEERTEYNQRDPNKVTQTPTQTRLNSMTEDSFEMGPHETQNDQDREAELEDHLDLTKDSSPMSLDQEGFEDKDSSEPVPSNPRSNMEDGTSSTHRDSSSTTKSKKAQAKKNKKKQRKKNKKAVSNEDNQDLDDLLISTYGRAMSNERLPEKEFSKLKELNDEKLEPDSIDALVNQSLKLHDDCKDLRIILTQPEFINLNDKLIQNLQSWVLVKAGLWNKYSKVTEARLRFISFSEQFTQKLIVQNWKNLKKFLSPSAVKFAQALKAEEEFPIFEESGIEEWLKLQEHVAPVMADVGQKKLFIGLFCDRYTDRLATFHLMSHLDQQHKDYLKPKMGELMKRGAKASALLLISNLLEYPSALESWGSLSKDKMLVQAELLSQALMGKYFPVKDNGDICLKIFDNMSNNWIREYTRDVLLNTDTRVLPCFETKLKKFIHFCDKITYSYKDVGITVGEALAGFHIGLNQDRLLDLFQMMEAAGAQWYQRAKTWTIRKWPKSLKSELVGKHDLIKQFFDLRDEKMQGLDTQIEKWKREH